MMQGGRAQSAAVDAGMGSGMLVMGIEPPLTQQLLLRLLLLLLSTTKPGDVVTATAAATPAAWTRTSVSSCCTATAFSGTTVATWSPSLPMS